MMQVMLFQGATPDTVGLIPYMLDKADPRPAREQFHERYAHGGGWLPFKGHTLSSTRVLTYPGDPPLKPIAQIDLRDECVLIYQHAWVVIVQRDGTWECCRMD